MSYFLQTTLSIDVAQGCRGPCSATAWPARAARTMRADFCQSTRTSFASFIFVNKSLRRNSPPEPLRCVSCVATAIISRCSDPWLIANQALLALISRLSPGFESYHLQQTVLTFRAFFVDDDPSASCSLWSCAGPSVLGGRLGRDQALRLGGAGPTGDPALPRHEWPCCDCSSR